MRGKNEFKEMWITDEVDYDLDDVNAFLGTKDSEGGLIYALEQARIANTAILLDTTDNGDAPLMAGAFIKHDGNGDPDNQGDERVKCTSEAKVDGLQKPIEMATYKKIIACRGLRKNLYHVDRRLAVIERGNDLVMKVNGDGTNNTEYITVMAGEQVGALKDVFKRRAISKFYGQEPDIPENASPGTLDEPWFVQIITPEHSTERTFNWDDVFGAVSYEVSINGEIHITPVSSLTLMLAGDDPARMYYWKVRAFTGTVYGEWSSVKRFGIYSENQ